MLLSEAIVSNLPFKISGQEWLVCAAGRIVTEKDGRSVTIYRTEDLLSRNWVTREPETFLTKSQFLQICDSIFVKNKTITREEFVEELCKEFGFRKEIKTK